jgi:hypothetical protein
MKTGMDKSPIGVNALAVPEDKLLLAACQAIYTRGIQFGLELAAQYCEVQSLFPACADGIRKLKAEVALSDAGAEVGL